MALNILEAPAIIRRFGDGKKYMLFLGADELRRIKVEAGRGFYTLYRNFAETAEPHEVATVIRLGLIGGGMEPQKALELVSYYAEPPRSLKWAYLLAYEVLEAAWIGVAQYNELTAKKEEVIPEEIDGFFDIIEAQLLAAGADASVLKGKSFAEVRALMYHLGRAGKEKPEAPSEEMFRAIKQVSERKG